MFLITLLYYRNPPEKVTVVLSPKDKPEEIIRRLPLYADIRILEEPTKEYRLLNNTATCYICRNHVCLPPENFFY